MTFCNLLLRTHAFTVKSKHVWPLEHRCIKGLVSIHGLQTSLRLRCRHPFSQVSNVLTRDERQRRNVRREERLLTANGMWVFVSLQTYSRTPRCAGGIVTIYCTRGVALKRSVPLGISVVRRAAGHGPPSCPRSACEKVRQGVEST